MNNCYERVLEILGKDQDDPLFIQFMKDLEEMPAIIDYPPRASEYMFDNAGLVFHYENEAQCFVSVFFHWASAAVRSGRVKQYDGNLAAAMWFGDARDVVQRKLGVKPVSSTGSNAEIGDDYELPPFELHCKFDSAEKLDYLSVWYMPACYWRAKS